MKRYREGVVVLLENALGQIALQLRDDGQNSGYWGLFGGWMENDETPVQAVIREIHEELCCLLDTSKLNYLGVHSGENVKSHVFHYPVAGELREARLTEGQMFQFVSWADICTQKIIPRHLEMLKFLGKSLDVQ